MAIIVDRYIGSNGEVLLPTTVTADNTSDLLSLSGVYYKVQTTEVVSIEAGNPMGLLLTLTYPATP
jgi:hypothetical protein